MGKPSALTIWRELEWCSEHCDLFQCNADESEWWSEHVFGCPCAARLLRHKRAEKREDFIHERW